MTHHTDAERAEFEAWARSVGLPVDRAGFGLYAKVETQAAWMAWQWQAARRAPAVHKRCDLCKDDGGYFYGRTGYEPCCVDAAVPHPPEATVNDSLTVEAAPVQMPEPVAIVVGIDRKVFADGVLRVSNASVSVFDLEAFDLGSKLYTEHLVGQLLAQHGIK